MSEPSDLITSSEIHCFTFPKPALYAVSDNKILSSNIPNKYEKYGVPSLIFVSGSYKSCAYTVSSSITFDLSIAVSSISCIKPLAPLLDVASGLKLLSAFIIA